MLELIAIGLGMARILAALLVEQETRRKLRALSEGAELVGHLKFMLAKGIAPFLRGRVRFSMEYRRSLPWKRRTHRQALILRVLYPTLPFDLKEIIRYEVRRFGVSRTVILEWQEGAEMAEPILFPGSTTHPFIIPPLPQVDSETIASFDTLSEEDPEEPGALRTVYLGLGGAGVNILRMYMERTSPLEVPFLRIVLIESDGQKLREIEDPLEESGYLKYWMASKHCIVVRLGKAVGSAGRPNVTARLLAEKQEEIVSAVGNAMTRVVFAAGGGGAGSGVGKLAEFLRVASPVPLDTVQEESGEDEDDEEEIPATLAVFIMPFGAEGGRARERALAARKALQDAGACVFTFYNQCAYHPDNPLRTVFEEALIHDVLRYINYLSIFPFTTQLARMTLKPASGINRDPSDLGKIARKNDRGYMGYLEWSEDLTNEQALEKLLNDPLQDPVIVDESTHVVLDFRGPFRGGDVNFFMSAVRDRAQGRDKNKMVEIRWGVDKGERRREVFIVTGTSKEEKEPDVLPVSRRTQQKQVAVARKTSEPLVEYALLFDTGFDGEMAIVELPATYVAELSEFSRVTAKQMPMPVGQAWRETMGKKLKDFLGREVKRPQRITFKSEKGENEGQRRDYMVPALLAKEWNDLREAGAYYAQHPKELPQHTDFTTKVPALVESIHEITGELPELPPGVSELVERQKAAALRDSQAAAT